MKKALMLLIVASAAYYYFHQVVPNSPGDAPPRQIEAPLTQTSESWRAGQQVRGTGTVSRVLPDDNDGSSHQRFILQLSSGRTLLIAHNIDLAPRVSSLKEGDTVSFYGEYEPNDKGGVIHWTHSDPQGRHTPGWLEHNGRRYQ
jgi:hypothetical protein